MKVNLNTNLKGLLLLIVLCGVVLMDNPMRLSNPVASAQETKTIATEEASYSIGPLDLLEIQVWREPDLTRQVIVRPDGKITFPLIDDILASGMTPLDLKAVLMDRLKHFVDNPVVTVTVVESRSKNFYVTGKVNAPGTYPLRPNMTVLQALSVAGGFADWAHKDSIRIIRSLKGTQEIFTFDYDKVISGKRIKQNISLEPDDTIIVP